jgi:hypothetical protein
MEGKHTLPQPRSAGVMVLTSPCGESNAGDEFCQDCAYVRHGRLEIRDDASAGAVGGSALPQVTELDQQGGQLWLQPPALAS